MVRFDWMPRSCVLAILLAWPAASARGAEGDAAPPMDCDGGMMPTAPALQLHGFADVSLSLLQTQPDGGTRDRTSSFALGQVDFFLVSHLGPNVSFLSEIALEGDETGESKAEVERVFVRYARDDRFHLSVGRVHTALGYWNEVFHHGRLLQPTTDRPVALRFEDDGGLLPVHAVGVEAGGTIEAGALRVQYVGNVANGRGPHRELVQADGDAGPGKAVALKLSVSHEGSTRVLAGPMIYRDVIPPDPGDAARAASLDETIAGVHAAVLGEKFTLLGEYFRVHHQLQGAGGTHTDHHAGYALASVDVTPRLRPYLMIDRVDFAPGDAYFAGIDSDATTLSAGLRISLTPANAVKLEYQHVHHPTEDADAIVAQTAFSF